ncbi:MAG: hypothetical protein KAT77_04225 [Nanoarchaeota archaeon]|nr:hypothetical protein [Nanoarchaeota archaeon]
MFKKSGLLILLLILLGSAVYAADEITQLADRLNFWTDGTHVVTVTNSGADAVQVNVSIPTGFAYSAGCSNPAAGIISCDVGPSGSQTYTVTSTAASFSEYELGLFGILAINNTYTGNNVSFIKIQDDELFHTLIEYGRGRGNYFYDTYGSGLAGSGHTGTGCSYVPNGTMFELNYLHKINNIKQYFGDLTAEAYNATFSCTYPNNTIVREHLITSITTDTSGASVSYRIPSIGGSWERMGFLGMDFNADAYATGSTISVNCTNMTYLFPAGGGNFVVDEDSFSLQVRNREPFIASASAIATIGNGTQEVLITYNITNSELYTVDDVVIEIGAPSYASFIGVRGELWGSALDQYRIEKAQLLSGESEIIRLVARFDTSTAPDMATIDLTQGIDIEYTTCWELNAYNPGEYVQTLTGVGTGAVNMGVASQITGIFDRLDLIYNLTVAINETVLDINETVENIKYIVEIINTTTQDTNVLVKAINSTSYEILNKTEYLVNHTNLILNDTQFISDQLNCNGTDDSPICDSVNLLNQSLYDLLNLSLMINYTAYNLNITVIENINTSGLNITVEVDLSNITTSLLEIKTFINCTNTSFDSSLCNRVARIENNTLFINNTLKTILDTTTYFNTSVFGNLTFQEILDAIDDITIDTSEVLTELQESRAFSEEIVFLITDSFGLQQQAGREFASGNVGSALNSLTEAQAKLGQAADGLAAEREGLAAEELGSFSTSWVWVAFVFILIAGVVIFYLFGRVPPPMEKGGKASIGPLKLLLLFLFLFLCAALASAQTISQFAEALNFDSTKNLTVNVNYGCTGGRQFNVTVPGGSGYEILTASGACTAPSTTVAVCDFNGQQTGTYNISHSTPSSLAYYTVYEFPTILNDATNCDVQNNISVIRIPDDEVFHTLVEYGRGRGNYFYSTRGGAGSGGTGTGCSYVPNGTMFELNFLHKIFSIKQYFDDPYLLAANATFSCTYPNRTIVRSHQGTSISQSALGTTITYLIDEVEGSWERMGYVGLQFDSTEQDVGDNLTITCQDISYVFGDLGGNIAVYDGGISFDLEVRNPEPFIAQASTTTATIGNGTQEVVITYNITNNELYIADDVVIEIGAPPYAEFIGVRGELWGSALDQYRIEKISLDPGESEIIQLVARFDTSNAPNIASVNLTNGIRFKYVTCWDLNAYNPAESVQNLFNIGGAIVDMGVPASIINIRERIEQIYYMVNYINITTVVINNTVTYIENIVLVINSTTLETNLIVQEINLTLVNISTNLDTALTNTETIIIETTTIKELIDCDGVSDSFICSQLDDMNNSVNNITNILLDINNTLNDISINVTINLEGQNLTVNATPDLTSITLILDDILAELNCSMNWTTEPDASLCKTLSRIENNTVYINNSIEQINNLVNYFNATVFGNVTLQQIFDAIGNTSLDTSDLLTEISQMREFNEELVFLVTDAFGLQQAAKADLDNGNLGSAAAKLREANAKLNEAAVRLTAMQEEDAAMEIGEEELGFTWVLILAGAIMLAALGFYLFSRPKET